MTEFVYLYRRPNGPPGSPKEMQERLQRWREWFTRMEAEGRLAQYGLPLEPARGRVVRDAAGGFTDGPYAETKDVVIGFSVVRAADEAEAVALTRGHPLFEQGGMIEIRPILKME